MAKKKQTMAQRADRHELYQKSVQAPNIEIAFLKKKFKKIRKRSPLIMREDFCGTAYLSTEWCKKIQDGQAIGVDLCHETLQWGEQNNIKKAGTQVAKRIELINDNVLTVKTREVDLICAFNFSYCIFETRQLMRDYFSAARSALKSDGLFFLDLLGGTATLDVVDEERDIINGKNSFTYIWDQLSFNPIDNHMDCAIHFAFPDGSLMESAFTYQWRLWSIPEIHELLLEAGFKKVHFYWEKFMEDKDDSKNEYLIGTGKYREVTKVDQQESWLVYIIAEK